ncbi:MAG: response regulator transcription factor [Burkholderiaceae bacterium]|nr:response regulator transcription factor [Burkholderiaceae bacterium]
MKVLLVDDHPLILAALQQVIQGVGDDVTVIGVETAEAARQVLREDDSVDLVLLDLALGEVDGFEVLAELRATWPAVPVVVVSASERTSDVIRALDLGAMGFVPKTSSNDSLIRALHAVMNGGLFVPPHMLGLTAAQVQTHEPDTMPQVMRMLAEHAKPEPHQSKSVSLESIGLTPRQTEVLALLLQGLPNKLIARQLNVSVETVKDHVAAVLRALNVSTRTQAVLAVSQMTQGAGIPGVRPGGR